MTFESDRSLAGVGALLIGIGMVFPPLGFVGIILLLVGVNGLANFYGDRAIFSHALWGLLFLIIGFAAAIVLVFVGLLGGAFFIIATAGFGAVGLVIGALIVGFVFFLLSAVYYRKSFDILRDRSGEGLFGTAGTLLFIGAILTIILIGLFLMLIAWIIVAVAFFSMRAGPGGVPQPGVGVSVPPPPPVSAVAAKRFCSNCGAENKPDATYCSSCGQKL